MGNALVKKVEPSRLNDPQDVFDVQEVYGDSGTTLRLFPPNPTSETLNNNYQNNPLPGRSDYDLLALGLELLPGTVRMDGGNNVDPVSIINTIASGVLRFEIMGGKERAFVHPLHRHLDFSRLDFNVETGTLNIGEEVFKLFEPFELQAENQFKVTLEWPSVDGLPDQSDWDASVTAGNNSGILGFRATLQVNQYEGSL